jgi:hypothetical protein
MSSPIREMYHTQEKWRTILTAPIPTTNQDAWLGDGYYFWYYENDAVWWGRTAKRRTRYYEVYKATVNCENVLDTVFNEDHYTFWIKNIEKAINKYMKSGKNSLTLKYINDFFKEKGVFEGIDGVLFQDISDNPENWIVKKFQYKKRIQIAVYNLDIISNFALEFEAECA